MRPLPVLLALLLFACGEAAVVDPGDASSTSDTGLPPAGDAAHLPPGADAAIDQDEDAGDLSRDAAPRVDAAAQAGADAARASPDAAQPGPDAGEPPPPCLTRVTYGAAWFKPSGHPDDFDDAQGVVTWDGSCAQDAAGNSFATLSNGWKPFFQGRSGCVLALDQRGSCPAPAPACSTRIGYGDTWLPAPGHPDYFDDVAGRVTWDGVCRASAGNSVAQLSNGWGPTFSGSGACEVALRYTQCGGLYANPVVDVDCPDPGVMLAAGEYYLACTSGSAANAYPLRKSADLVHWQLIGSVMPQGYKPSWATGDFWAPELHQVGSTYVAYFSARHTNGVFALGAATSTRPEGPYTAQPQPLLQTASPGVIDVHYFEASNGTKYLLWKPDGNAVGQKTPIRIQTLAADGLSLTGTATTLIENDLGWEGGVIEGPWMIERGGFYYLFYSANGYASTAYAVGVARATSPTGPFTKAGNPILVTRGAWAGPGHGSVLPGPSGDWMHVYHAWMAGKVGQSPGRLVLADRVTFENGWPVMHAAPSTGSQPMP
ncbi:MAG TPA: glycoside hydrolase family 43 protein [Myxococcales bacterium]|jgi:GH43 family beta-xylosidase